MKSQAQPRAYLRRLLEGRSPAALSSLLGLDGIGGPMAWGREVRAADTECEDICSLQICIEGRDQKCAASSSFNAVLVRLQDNAMPVCLYFCPPAHYNMTLHYALNTAQF